VDCDQEASFELEHGDLLLVR